jgi:hypothetical protein
VRNGNIVSGSTVSDSGVLTPAGFSHGISGPNISQVLVTGVHFSGLAGYAVDGDGQNPTKQVIVSHCTAIDCDKGFNCNTISDSSAVRCRDLGIVCHGNATNSTGGSFLQAGLACYGNATNCTGTSSRGSGLFLNRGNATNCTGSSSSENGIVCFGNATNCVASTESGSFALRVYGTASFCRGYHNGGGTSIDADIAIGCTTGNGPIVSNQKHLGTL